MPIMSNGKSTKITDTYNYVEMRLLEQSESVGDLSRPLTCELNEYIKTEHIEWIRGGW